MNSKKNDNRYKSRKKTLTVYLDTTIAEKVEKKANKEKRSVNYILNEIIKSHFS